jgi:carbon-monoxide dehydrogenase large subunit
MARLVMLDRTPNYPGSTRPFVGRPLPRFEDVRLVQGNGRFTDDFSLPRECHAVFVRSPYPHARIVTIDTTEARRLPGVLAIVTGADYVAAGGKPIAHFAEPADARDHTKRAFRSFAGNVTVDIAHLPMPIDRVRYLGEPVLLVVGESLAAAHDAAERVTVSFDELPSVTDAQAALRDGAPCIDKDVTGNLVVDARFGDRDATDKAIAGSALVIEQIYVNQRIVCAQMEPRSVIVDFDAASGIVKMIAGSQGAIRQRDTLAAALGLERDKVICPDVGGGFGTRTNLAPEQPVLAVAARQIGRPVRWTSTRSEAFLTDYQCRDIVTRVRMGFGADGRISGYDCEIIGNVGAYTVAFVPMANSFRVMTTVYNVPQACVAIKGALTNTVPTSPFRGAGRPEATYAMERTLDIAAARLNIDRIEIRRRNLVAHKQLPYTSALGLTYDSGDFVGNLERVLDVADWSGFAQRRKAASRRGRLAGIGVSNYVESPVGIPHERIDVTVQPEGIVKVVTGTQSTGQGHETTFAQVMADRLGVTPEKVRLISGDTRIVQSGGGSHSDRSMRIGGALLVESSAGIVARARDILAHHLHVAPEDVAFSDGLMRSKNTNDTFDLFEVAKIAEQDASLPEPLRGPLSASASFTGRMPAYPTGAAVCEIEIDPETGAVEVTRYTSIDDAGQPINPLILHGQVHGGIAQGVGQALYEGVAYDAGSGQVATGSFMDYQVARAHNMPNFSVDLAEDPTHGNPLRVKGGGESGITPALATTINAVVDALSEFGIEHVDMPASPAKVWTLINKATEGGP